MVRDNVLHDFKIYLLLFCGLIYSLSERMFHAQNVYSIVIRWNSFIIRWNVLCMSVSITKFIMFLRSSFYLFIFCLVVLFILESGMLKSETIIVQLFILPLNSVSFGFVYFGDCAVRCGCIYNCYIFLMD